ncbi:MAG: type II secretion system protein, partial [Alphaproteobacteria bacterium]|nr:type II secretion system protein [Alphaproteobacteria bacterium]
INCHAVLAMTKNAQSGRSMIEMLGVLAIIGVLSVGGIAGYSKAMMKYRINKTIEQITLIAGNVRAFWGPQKNYIGVDCYGGNCNASGCEGVSGVNAQGNPTIDKNGCPIIKKAKIFPDEMITVTDGKIMSITNPFGYGVALFAANKAKSGDYQAFFIQYNLPLDEEVCIELVSQDWSLAGGKCMEVAGDGDEGLVDLKIPVSLDTAVAKCSTIVEESINNGEDAMYITMFFDVDLNSDFYKNWSLDN